jgi:hypothetical protein
MKKAVSIVGVMLLTLLPKFVYAIERNNSELSFGFFAGANLNEITGIAEMLVSDPQYSGFEFKDEKCWGFTGGIFLNYRPHHLFSIQPELGFAMKHGLIKYSDINEFEYDLNFKYNYLNVGTSFKLHIPRCDLFLSITPQIGFNLTPSNLYYTSNGEDQYGPDLQTQQLMRNVIKGRTNVTLAFGLGYQFWNRFYVDARYYLGLSDMIETHVNSYGFKETVNFTNGFQFTVGYAFPLK